jgi:hypothetical protein
MGEASQSASQSGLRGLKPVRENFAKRLAKRSFG